MLRRVCFSRKEIDMSYADFTQPLITAWRGLVLDFAPSLFTPEAETHRVTSSHPDPTEFGAADWQNAWIDLGGEG
jgi:hypothetical protein